MELQQPTRKEGRKEGRKEESGGGGLGLIIIIVIIRMAGREVREYTNLTDPKGTQISSSFIQIRLCM